MAGNMEKKATRGGKKTKSNKSLDEELTLEFIQELGGTKEDLRLLADVDDDVEDLDNTANDFESEPIKKDELKNFMEQLGIFDHRPDTEKVSKKPKKLLTADVEDDSDDNKVTPKAAGEESIAKKKKKEKNKFKLKSDAESSESSHLESQKQEKKKVKEQESSPELSKKKKKEKNKFKIQHEEISSTTSATGLEELLSHLKTHPQRTHLLVKPGDTWMDNQVKSGADEVTKDLIHQCEQFAAKLLEDEVELYKKQRDKMKKGESNWMRTVLTSGTLTDKMAALTLLVQESPVHNMAALDSLVAMTKKKGKREAMLASDTLKNLLVSESSPFPDDRKLIAFDTRPLSTLWHVCSGNRDSVDRRLITWHAEDLLRQKYAAFVKALDVMSYDTLLSSKEKALTNMHSLLVNKPEQEEVLLPMLVNKLGDPNHKIASKASYLLIKLVEQHPNMKAIIVGEVERLVYRPNVAQRAQYYAMCFLNQIKLHRGDQTLASQLISIFFTFFKIYVTKGEVDSKMMAALLTGVNRAYPYAKLKRDFLSEQITTLYKIVHVVNFNTSIQALMLLHQVVDPSNSESDRYFMALYRKLLDPALRTSAKQAQFLNLIYKSMKADLIEKRVKALMKRLLQAGALLGPNFMCGALIVISEVLKEKPSLLAVKQLGKQSARKKEADDLILKKAAGEEVEENKVDFYDSDSDEEERFVDLPLPPEFQEDSQEAPAETNAAGSEEEGAEMVAESNDKSALKKDGSSWNHRLNLTGKSGPLGYSAYQRNPLHCQAENECLWELQALVHHYHPSVSLFAQKILQGESIVYTGDPLQDFTLMRFLDRFVYKNPKKKEAEETQSETVGSSGKKKQSSESIPVNSAEFIERGEEAVPEHERYLYRYFSQKADQKKKDEEDSDAGSVSDSEFDAYLDKYEKQMDYDDLGDMDFGDDLAGKKGSKGLADFGSSSDEDDTDDKEGDGGLSDEEIDFGDDDDDELAAEFRREMEALKEGSDGDDELAEDEDEGEEEGDDFSGDELKQMMLGGGGKKRKHKQDVDFDMPVEKKKRRQKGGLESMFAVADNFADILEGNMEASAMMGTADDVIVTDKASAKQIKWEAERERQLSGRDWRQKKRKGGKRGAPKGGKPPVRGGGGKGNAGRRLHQGKRKRK